MNAALGNSSNCNKPPPSLLTQGGVRCGDRTIEDNMGLSHPKGSGLQGFTALTLAFSAQARDPWAGSPTWQRRWSDEVTSPGMPPCTRPTVPAAADSPGVFVHWGAGLHTAGKVGWALEALEPT